MRLVFDVTRLVVATGGIDAFKKVLENKAHAARGREGVRRDDIQRCVACTMQPVGCYALGFQDTAETFDAYNLLVFRQVSSIDHDESSIGKVVVESRFWDGLEAVEVKK
jgi:hypothetical protein